MRHFKQTRITSPPRYQDAYVKFQPVADGEGVLAVDETQNAGLVAELDRLADAKKLNVVRISAEVYESLKKNPMTARKSPPQHSAFGNSGVKLFKQNQTLHGALPKASPNSSKAAEPVRPLRGTPAVTGAEAQILRSLQEQEPAAPPARIINTPTAPAAPPAPETPQPIIPPKAKAKKGKKADVAPPESTGNPTA